METTKTLFCIVGETASGKDYMANKIINDYPYQFKMIVSYTTRPKRDNETDGVEHYFVTEEEFHKLHDEKADEVLAYTKIESEDAPDGYEYMALVSDLQDHNVYIIDPNGIHYINENFPNIQTCSIFVYAPLEDRIQRAEKTRSDFKEKFMKRVKQESEQFNEFRINKEWNYFVDNSIHLESKSFEVFRSFMLYELQKETARSGRI